MVLAVPPFDSSTRRRVEAQFYDALVAVAGRVQDSELADLSVNEFMMAWTRPLLGLSSSEEYARFLLQQRVERSLSTTLGTVLSAVANEVAVGRTKESSRQIIVLVRRTKRIGVVIKTGPKSMNPAQATRFRTKLRRLPGGQPDVTVLGLCYGSSKQVSASLLRYLGSHVQVKAGRDLWIFLTGDDGSYREVLKAAAAAAERYQAIHRRDLIGRLDDSTVGRIARQIDRSLGVE